jgi:hydrogenase nickel incorporation protein HypA/HybF
MHELALMQSTVATVVEQARRHGAGCVHRVTIRVGEFSGADADAMRIAFPLAAQGTPAAGAELRIDPGPGRELLLTRVEMT